MDVERAFGKQTRTFRLVIRLIERTITRHGQHLLLSDIQLEGWWTSLDDDEALVIERYRDHGTHEQFHSEFKTDLDLERLPSGKFDTNDVILRLGMLAYNCLRLLGQLGLLGDLAPIRHPAKRRRIRTVLQEIMYRALLKINAILDSKKNIRTSMTFLITLRIKDHLTMIEDIYYSIRLIIPFR